MIIVTGATGQLGSQIVNQLLQRVPAEQIGVSVRDPDRAADLAGRGVRVRRGDFTQPDGLAEAFEGASRVLIVSSNTVGQEAIGQHTRAISAARDAGADRIFYTSHQAAGADSLFTPTRDHAVTEEFLAQLSVPSTSLRNGFYASTVPQLLGSALDTGELAAPADGPVSWTTHADLAEAAAVLLADPDPDPAVGPTAPLTAAEAVDLEGIAALLSEITGRTVRRVVVDDDEWTAGLVGHGVPAAQAEMMLGMFRASRRGEFATVDPTLGELLQRPPLTVRSVLEGVVGSR